MTSYELFDFLSFFIFTVLLLPSLLYGIGRGVSWANRKNPEDPPHVWVILGCVVGITIIGFFVRPLIFLFLEQCFGLQKPPLTSSAVGRHKYLSQYNVLGGLCGLALLYLIAKITTRK